MIIDCISDLHGFYPNLEGGDLLILGGDITAADNLTQWAKFFHWLKKQPYEKKILIAGNHDNFLKSGFPNNQKEADDLKEVQSFLEEQKEMDEPDFEYLCDSGTEYNGLKVWGSPWTKTFDRMNPHCMAFTCETEEELSSKFSLIPKGTDILITHGPMCHILDANAYGYACGSTSLRDHIDRVKPRFHVFGHIHEQGGNQLMYKHIGPNTWCINCSYVDERYRDVNKPIRVIL